MKQTNRRGHIPDTEEQNRCVRVAEYLVEHRCTVRAAARYFGISKSTVHKDLTEKLRMMRPSLYEAARLIMDENKAQRHIRGGRATKDKYQRQAEAKRHSSTKKSLVTH